VARKRNLSHRIDHRKKEELDERMAGVVVKIKTETSRKSEKIISGKSLMGKEMRFTRYPLTKRNLEKVLHSPSEGMHGKS